MGHAARAGLSPQLACLYMDIHLCGHHVHISDLSNHSTQTNPETTLGNQASTTCNCKVEGPRCFLYRTCATHRYMPTCSRTASLRGVHGGVSRSPEARAKSGQGKK